MFDKQKLLFEIVNCVEFDEFKLASGRISPYKIDIDSLTADEAKLNFLAEQMRGFSISVGLNPDYFVGVPSGTTMLAREMTRQINYLPPEKKKVVWREKGDLEYKVPIKESDKVVVVEDVVTTGGSLEFEVNNLKRNGVNVMGVIAIVDRFERNKDFEFPYNYAIGIDELFSVLERKNKIPNEFKPKIEEYMNKYVRRVA